ncbi:hypothetical protein QBC41DRAFT_330336 [Cercophora samala]|uniref:Uncharacterized protein n=1 Tax=Cercophora samala TaxID=330535 RepID=A0AA39YZT9_9PEZI|nr:hypothetical protein QBC41DRAFT_330336 [Cercophora samala]
MSRSTPLDHRSIHCEIQKLGQKSHNVITLLDRQPKRTLRIRNCLIRGPYAGQPVRLNFTKLSVCEAVLLQTRGDVHEGSGGCTHCRRGFSPFIECVREEGIFRGSCAGCHYSRNPGRCSLREWNGQQQSTEKALSYTSPPGLKDPERGMHEKALFYSFLPGPRGPERVSDDIQSSSTLPSYPITHLPSATPDHSKWSSSSNLLPLTSSPASSSTTPPILSPVGNLFHPAASPSQPEPIVISANDLLMSSFCKKCLKFELLQDIYRDNPNPTTAVFQTKFMRWAIECFVEQFTLLEDTLGQNKPYVLDTTGYLQMGAQAKCEELTRIMKTWGGMSQSGELLDGLADQFRV